MKRFLIALSLCASSLASAQTATQLPAAPPAEAPKLTPEQLDSIVKQLDQIEGVVTKNRDGTIGGAMARFSKAVAGGEKATLELYMECYKVEHFERVNLKVTDYQDWARRNEDRNKDPEFLYGLWLQLSYLVLSLQAQDAKDMGPVIAGVQSFIGKEIAAVQSATTHTAAGAVKDNDKTKKSSGKGGRTGGSGSLLTVLRDSVRQSEFARAYLLKDFLKKEEWEYEPMAIGSIYESAIFPYYLEKKPAELAAQWDARIKSELTIKQALQSESEYALFYKEQYPKLLWKKAKFLYDNNVNPILAMADMLKLVRDNPTHADAKDWLKQLRDAVGQKSPDTPPTTGGVPSADATAQAK